MISPDSSIREVGGIGEKTAEKLEKLGIVTIRDLLQWYPREYIDASHPVPVISVPYGRLSAIRVRIGKVSERYAKNRHITLLEAKASDDSGEITLRWFNQKFLKAKLVEGTEVICIGVVSFFNHEKVMTAPLIEQRPSILSVYAQTKGVTSKMLRGYIDWCMHHVDLGIDDLPDDIKIQESLQSKNVLLAGVHQPKNIDEIEEVKRQIAFSEVFWFFVRMASARKSDGDEKGFAISLDLEWIQQIVSSLPFELTKGQKRAVWDGLQDMSTGRPMTRLLNGDVGSGKTVVSALLAAAVAKSGFQSALLAPTEILAQQHAESVKELLEPFGLRVALYTASHKEDLSEAQIVIGTHAPLQTGVELPKLAFITIDEQHRFGVKQRQALREGKTELPHLLSMTATPIPRTLALSLYGDLSLSMLPEKPKDRLAILTEVVYPAGRKALYKKLEEEVTNGHQIFVICSLIQEKEVDVEGSLFAVLSPDDRSAAERKTVVAEVERLRKEYPQYVIEAVHGKMKPAEKQAVMQRMATGEVQILVATSVVEVGVNIPNATVMVIEGAEAFGLAQLHQFRGRVGRSTMQSYCFLCPSKKTELVDKRMQIVAGTESGFDLAQADLELRGPGELIGSVQSGLPDFRMASLTDLGLLQHVKSVVDDYNVTHPEFLQKYSEVAYKIELVGLE